MALSGQVITRFGVDSSAYAEGVKKLKDSNKGFVEDLKSKFGARSGLKDALEIAVGGGAVAALGMAGRMVEDLSAGVLKLADDFRDPAVSAGEMADKFASSLPILGNVYNATKNLSDAFTGAKSQAEAMAAAAKNIDNIADSLRRSRDFAIELKREFAAFQQSLQFKSSERGLSGRELQDSKASHQAQADMRAAAERAESLKDAKTKADEESLKGVRDQLKPFQAQGIANLKSLNDQTDYNNYKVLKQQEETLEQNIANTKKRIEQDLADRKKAIWDDLLDQQKQNLKDEVADRDKAAGETMKKAIAENKQQEKQLAERKKALEDSLQTPLEKFNATMAAVKEITGGTGETFERARKQALDEYIKSTGGDGAGGRQQFAAAEERRTALAVVGGGNASGSGFDRVASEQQKTRESTDKVRQAIENQSKGGGKIVVWDMVGAAFG